MENKSVSSSASSSVNVESPNAFFNFFKGTFVFFVDQVKYMNTLSLSGKMIHIVLSLILISSIVYFIVHIGRLKCSKTNDDSKAKFTQQQISEPTPKKVFKKAEYPKPEISFYHWEQCVHCKNFQPEWEKFKTMVSEQQLDYIVADYEVTKDYEHIRERGINAFPTITLNDEEVKFENSENRNADFLMNYVKQTLLK